MIEIAKQVVKKETRRPKVLKPKQPRLFWDAEKGWLLEVDLALGEHQIKRIAEWALPLQKDRYRSLLPGFRKEECAKTIKDLEAGKIQQLIVRDPHGSGVIWSSTERRDKSKTYFHGK